jgi:hypothetical protein
LQTLDLLQQCLLLLLHLAKQFSNNGVLGFQDLDFAIQVARFSSLRRGRTREHRH